MQIGCCLVSFILILGPRFILFWEWMLSDWYNAFETWYYAFLCWLFVPWTSMVYIYAYFNNNGQINGWYWFWIVFAVFIDLGSVSSSSNKKQK